jgi:hypothetical protein
LKQFSWKEYLETGKGLFPLKQQLKDGMLFKLKIDSDKSDWKLDIKDGDYDVIRELKIKDYGDKNKYVLDDYWWMPYNFLKEHFEYIGG